MGLRAVPRCRRGAQTRPDLGYVLYTVCWEVGDERNHDKMGRPRAVLIVLARSMCGVPTRAAEESFVPRRSFRGHRTWPSRWDTSGSMEAADRRRAVDVCGDVVNELTLLDPATTGSRWRC